MKSPLPCVLVSAALIAGVSAGAEAQVAKRSSVSGTIVSRSATVGPAAQAVLYETPSDEFFIVTQVCTSEEADGPGGSRGPSVAASVFGSFPVRGSNESTCTDFVPGIALANGETVTCNASEFQGGICVVTGVLRSN